jgi:predicted metal-dependent enzyme (double-stranded beta helix superfamily)
MLTPSAFIEGCTSCIASGGGPQEIARLLAQAIASQAANPGVWEGDELLYRADDLLIANVTLPPGCRSPVHDHGTWAVIGVSSGCEMQHFHESVDGRLVPSGEQAVRAGEVRVLPPRTIHAISNPLATPTRCVHVYGRDLITTARRMWHPESGLEMAFDMATFQQWEARLTQAGGHPGGDGA